MWDDRNRVWLWVPTPRRKLYGISRRKADVANGAVDTENRGVAECAVKVAVDCLSPKAQSTYFAEKLAEAECKANEQNAVWLDESEFWNEAPNP